METVVSKWVSSGELPAGCSILHQRPNGRGTLLRIRDAGSTSMIVKLWPVRTNRERLKCALRISNGRREWRIHSYLARVGLHVPAPIGYAELVLSPSQRYELMAVQDLGQTTRGLPYLKQCIQHQDEVRVQRFEDEVIEVARVLMRSRIVDVDHQLNNFVVSGRDEIARIDFECARRWLPGRAPVDELGRMIGRLICTHVYACQPDIERSEAFAARISERLQLPRQVFSAANALIVRNLGKQAEHRGIDSQLRLAW